MPDARVTGILIAHLGAFGSGELKSMTKIPGVNHFHSKHIKSQNKKKLFELC